MTLEAVYEPPQPPLIVGIVWHLTSEQAEQLYYYLHNAAAEYEHNGQPGSGVSAGAWIAQGFVDDMREMFHFKGYREWMANMGQDKAPDKAP